MSVIGKKNIPSPDDGVTSDMQITRLPIGRYKSECPACGSNAVWTGKVTDDTGFVLLEMSCASCKNSFDERNPDWQGDFTQ